MALEILWTKQADRKFDKIIDYLFHKWNQKVTESFVKKVYDTIDTLAEFPDIGTIEHKEKGIRGFTIVKQVNVFYKISGNKLIILDFFDNRQTPAKKRF
jgi:plasmid stabilization system protein ParE